MALYIYLAVDGSQKMSGLLAIAWHRCILNAGCVTLY